MTGYQSKKAAARDKLKCQCSLSTKLVGSGCQYCNPEYMDDDDTQVYKRPWVDVQDEEIKRLWIQYRAALPRYLCFAKALLAKTKEKNT